jgi:hypothetical protein
MRINLSRYRHDMTATIKEDQLISLDRASRSASRAPSSAGKRTNPLGDRFLLMSKGDRPAVHSPD